MKNKLIMFWVIMLIVITSIVVIATKPTKLGLDLVGGSRLVLEAQPANNVPVTQDMMSSLQFAIENRVNKLGVSETVVQRSGEKRLVVEIPDVSDLNQAKAYLGETAELDFRKPVMMPNNMEAWVPTGLTGKDLVRANLSTNSQNGQWVVDLEFNDAGTKKFAELTKAMIGQQMAIFFNGELQSAPVIREAIIGGRAQISGGDNGFVYEEAKTMVDLLNAGALPVPAKIIEENTVGPTLGADSIAKSKIAAILGLGFVMIFMLAYYRAPGIIANVALLIYGLILFALFKIIPVTLTLAGIAGFILSVGMAVDANVLIFERIREEFAAGKNVGDALKNGYGRAFTAIFDSNLTTVITGVILFVVGTGPVRGFAIMLVSGVAISMFTAVVVTRLIFDHTVKSSSVKPFRMLQFFKSPNFDFMKHSYRCMRFALCLAGVLIVVFAVRLVNNKADVLSVDLTGGTSIVFGFKTENQPSEKQIRSVLDKFDNAAVIQFQSTGVSDKTLLVKTGETSETAKGKALQAEGKDVKTHITSLLNEAFPEAAFADKQVDEVGSIVGGDLKRSGTYAVIFSLIAILMYVAFRFKFAFGLGAVVSLAHDALISIGLFSVCGRQISLIVITAVLTIIGYSVNDTVVIFDRIREILRYNKRLSLFEVCNKALNDCLGRTVITSLTTMFAVLSLFAFGDGSIFDFALIMLIGIIAGTFSTMFIATPIMVWWCKGKRPDLEEDNR